MLYKSFLGVSFGVCGFFFFGGGGFAVVFTAILTKAALSTAA